MNGLEWFALGALGGIGFMLLLWAMLLYASDRRGKWPK